MDYPPISPELRDAILAAFADCPIVIQPLYFKSFPEVLGERAA